MSLLTCQSCLTVKTDSLCECCQDPLCKKCTHFISLEDFRYAKALPLSLQHSRYCNSCFEKVVVPFQDEYAATLNQAKEIAVYNSTQGKETRLMRRGEEVFEVENCTDEQDAILRMAFWAVQGGYNALIDVKVSGKKVRDEGYQTMQWSGSGIPTIIKDRHIIKDRSFWSTPN
jgi:hypothetical protein